MNLPLPLKPRAWALPILQIHGGGDYLRSVPADMAYPNGDPMPWEPLYDKATLKAAVLAEREACAQMVDVPLDKEAWEIHGGKATMDVLRVLAKDIRARTQENGSTD